MTQQPIGNGGPGKIDLVDLLRRKNAVEHRRRYINRILRKLAWLLWPWGR